MRDGTHRRPLPSGRITFMLTDVVGSTYLWEIVPHLMPDALIRHEQLISAAVLDNGGVLLKSKGEGDSTFSVFDRPRDAARAAVEAQRSLRDEAWPDDCRITVRMALHTGEAVERDGDYFGRTVNRVARLRGIADGGEVLATMATAELVAHDLPDEARLVELGVQQLRDLDHPETVFLLTDLDDHDVRLATTHPLRELPLPTRVRSARQLPMVGRKEERHVLDAAWERAAAGRPGFVLIDGDAGIGKTRLATELASEVHDEGGIVLAGGCDDLGGAPFQPFAEAFRFVTERIPTALLPSLTPSLRRALGPLAPDLAAVSPDDVTADATLEREFLFLAVDGWLAALSGEAPVLFLIEDLHWATETTVDMLRSLLLHPSESRLLVVATTRPMPLRNDQLHRLLADAHHSTFTMEQIALSGLSVPETMLLLEDAERAVGPDSAAEVHTLTDGNPLFALAVASSFTARDDAGVSAGVELPGSVNAVIERQLHQLDDDALELFRCAAVLGTTFEIDLVADLARQPPEAVDEALDAGERHKIVREQSAGALHLYEFNHALLAAALVGQLTAIRRRRLHAAACRLLSTTSRLNGDRVSRVAYHAAHAGTALEPDEAIAAFREAALQARERTALPEARAWLDRARELSNAGEDEALQLDVDIEYGSVLWQLGATDARQFLDDVAARCRARGDGVRLAEALIASAAGGARDYIYVNRERIENLEAALELLPPDDSPLRARSLVILAGELLYSDEAHRLLALADDALAMARRVDDAAVLDTVLEQRQALLGGPPHVTQRLAENEEMLSLLDGQHVPTHRRFAVLGSRFQVLQQLGRIGEVEACLDELSAMADADDVFPRQRIYFTMAHGSRHLLAGRLADAEAAIRAAFRLLRAFGLSDTLGPATARQMLGVRFWQDRADTMLDSIAHGVTINPLLRAHHAYWLLLTDRRDDAAQVWAEWDDSHVETLLMVGGTGESTVVEAAATCAAFDGAERCRFYYSLLEPYGARIVNPFSPDLPTHHFLGLLADALHDRELAEQHFTDSIQFSDRIDAPLMAARSSFELAKLLTAWGNDRDRAVSFARDARATGIEREATWLTRESGELLAALGAS